MSKDRLSLDETIKQLDKRKLTIEGLIHHLDNIEHCTRMNAALGSESHRRSMLYSKQVIVKAFKELGINSEHS